MKLFEVLLFELVTIPNTSYGYWIDHAGVFWPVDHYQHFTVAAELFGSSDDPYNKAYARGWIRVVIENANEMSFEMTSPTERAAKSAWYLVMKNKDQLYQILVDTTGETDHNAHSSYVTTDTYESIRSGPSIFEGKPPKPANQFAQWIKNIPKHVG